MAKRARPTLRRFLKTRLVEWMTESSAACWQPMGQSYPRLSEIEAAAAGLAGMSGLYAVWHLGVRPQWLKIAATSDLGAALLAAKTDAVIGGFQANGGLYVAWLIAPPGTALSFVAHLTNELRPLFRHRHPSDLALAQGTPVVACPLPSGVGQPREPSTR